MPKQIPVYLFVGQLESGKTKFIQETMEDPNFDSGDKTLLLVCEEGEIEYDPSKFAFGGVHVAQIEDKSELTAENLTALEKKSGCGRVIIEYNGMWLIQELYDAPARQLARLPEPGHRRRYDHQDLRGRQRHAQPAAGQAARQ